jgi:lipoprotein-releasing system permease protein
LSLAVMILSVGVVRGFQYEIRDKIIGFDGHIQIKNLDLNRSRELALIASEQPSLEALKSNPNIERIAPFCNKAGILNTKNDIEGMLFKGVSQNYNWDFFSKNLVRGRVLELTDTTDTYEFMMAENVAKKLAIDTGASLEVFFIHDGKVRRRKMRLVGLYNTGLEEFDRMVCFTDLRVIQRIYSTDYSVVSGFEVYLKNVDDLEAMADYIDAHIDIKLRAMSVEDIHEVIFQWLKIVNSNATIIIVLMTLVSVMNLITAFLILIIDRTRMIGILKALGARNGQVVRVFLFGGLAMVVPGLLIGNIVGIGLALLQRATGLITIPEETYYMSVVPVDLNWMNIMYLNLGTLAISMIMMLIPALLVRTITPVKAIKFD